MEQLLTGNLGTKLRLGHPLRFILNDGTVDE
jgi:hypothetical protein